MIIGVDFDNTIVRYDALFHQIALEEQWIGRETPANKTAVRDAMRTVGLEEKWILLQGQVYGRRIAQAPAFDGVLSFFTACHHADIRIYIISHKTRFPISGEPGNLHDAARNWLKTQGFFDISKTSLTPSHAFFELTKADKLARIATLGCDHFIDDLPEFLAEPAFPMMTRKWLFSPSTLAQETSADTSLLASWRDAFSQIACPRISIHE